MTTWLIILLALWTYPIASLVVVHLTRNKPELRKKIIKVCIILNVVTTLSLLTNISTTLKEFDWVILTSFYFTTSLLIWLLYHHKNIILKVLSVLLMICIFGAGYILGTVGALGVGFVTAEFSPREEIWLGDGIILKETLLGNAISDYRGKRVEVYKTIPWLPIIEWRKMKKEYFNMITYGNKLTVNYKPNEDKIYLSASWCWRRDKPVKNWADTLLIED